MVIAEQVMKKKESQNNGHVVYLFGDRLNHSGLYEYLGRQATGNKMKLNELRRQKLGRYRPWQQAQQEKHKF